MPDTLAQLRLPGERLVGQPAPGRGAEHDEEPVQVGQLALVVGEGAFVQVPEQMPRLDGDVGAVQSPLEQGPEVLDPVDVHTAFDVLLGVVDNLVHVLVVEPGVGQQRVAVDHGALLNVLADAGLESPALRIGHDDGTDLAAARSTPATMALSLPPVPVILRTRVALCMFRALPPMKVSSTSISPSSFWKVPVCMASRMRWSRNHADF